MRAPPGRSPPILGIHDHDDRLADGSRDARPRRASTTSARFLADARGHRCATSCRRTGALERELALFSTRPRSSSTTTSTASGSAASRPRTRSATALFLLFARDSRRWPSASTSIASRLEAAPQHIEQQKSRLGQRPPVRLWNEMELERCDRCRRSSTRSSRRPRAEFGDDHRARSRGSRRGRRGCQRGARGLRRLAARAARRGDDDFALGREAYDELIGLRAFDGLTTDEILEIGEEQLAENHEARASGRARDRPRRDGAGGASTASSRTTRPTSTTRSGRLPRRRWTRRAQFVIDHDIATLPAGEHAVASSRRPSTCAT